MAFRTQVTCQNLGRVEHKVEIAGAKVGPDHAHERMERLSAIWRQDTRDTIGPTLRLPPGAYPEADGDSSPKPISSITTMMKFAAFLRGRYRLR
jgi:hypothetical protein